VILFLDSYYFLIETPNNKGISGEVRKASCADCAAIKKVLRDWTPSQRSSNCVNAFYQESA